MPDVAWRLSTTRDVMTYPDGYCRTFATERASDACLTSPSAIVCIAARTLPLRAYACTLRARRRTQPSESLAGASLHTGMVIASLRRTFTLRRRQRCLLMRSAACLVRHVSSGARSHWSSHWPGDAVLLPRRRSQVA